jgi:Translation machinery associated TMA7
MGRNGGKTPHQKKPQKEERELDESDMEFIAKKKKEAALLKEMQTKAAGKGPFSSGASSGIKRSGGRG